MYSSSIFFKTSIASDFSHLISQLRQLSQYHPKTQFLDYNQVYSIDSYSYPSVHLHTSISISPSLLYDLISSLQILLYNILPNVVDSLLQAKTSQQPCLYKNLELELVSIGTKQKRQLGFLASALLSLY